MTSTMETTDDNELKARHRKMWALGNYPAVAVDVIPELGPVLVAASGVRARDRVLDGVTGPQLAAELRRQGQRGHALLQFGLAGYAKRR